MDKQFAATVHDVIFLIDRRVRGLQVTLRYDDGPNLRALARAIAELQRLRAEIVHGCEVSIT